MLQSQVDCSALTFSAPRWIKNFMGIDDPYEAPLNPEIALDTSSHSAEANARLILDSLLQRGFEPK